MPLELAVLPLVYLAVLPPILWARHLERRRRERTAQCPTVRGRITRILDGSLVAAEAMLTSRMQDAPPFVARFEVMTAEGTVHVEPGRTRMVHLADLRVGDPVEIQGPSETIGGDAYRGPGKRIFRGTEDCPLELRRPI